LEHVRSQKETISRIQSLISPIWGFFNFGCSLSNDVANRMMKNKKFQSIDQTLLDVNLTNNFLINKLLNAHVIGVAIK
jgi:hypothetical protein